MTPERAKWYDSLPTEEKRVRYVIDYYKENIKFAKAVLKRNREAYQAKVCMQEHKQAIKALRKQIAMRPFRKEFGLFCPTCKDCLGVGWLHIVKTPHCSKCGQKLRWD